jgi:hypothetical protein
LDEEQVRAQARDFVPEWWLQSRTDGDHDNDRRDADDDSQRCQERADFVFYNRFPGNANDSVSFIGTLICRNDIKSLRPACGRCV